MHVNYLTGHIGLMSSIVETCTHYSTFRSKHEACLSVVGCRHLKTLCRSNRAPFVPMEQRKRHFSDIVLVQCTDVHLLLERLW